MDLLPFGIITFLVCCTTYSEGATCPEACICRDHTLDCTNKLLKDMPVLEGSFKHVYFSRNQLTYLSRQSIHLEGQSCTIDYSYNQLSIGIANISPSCEQLLANFSFNNFHGSLPAHFIFSNDGPNVTIDVSYNKIQRVERNTFNLHNSYSVTIDLSHNQITFIDTNAFELRHRITTFQLNLGNNKIQSLIQLTVYPFTTSIHLYLNDNLLTNLTASDIAPFSQLHINLARNPWSCDCHQSWIADSGSRFRGILSNKPQELLCNYPPKMKDRPVLELSTEEFSCPPEFDRAANVEIIANVGDTVELNCPFRGAVPSVQLINWTFVPRAKPPSLGIMSFSTPSEISPKIHNVTCEWVGTYFCHLENVGGDIGLNVTLSVNSLCKHNILTGLYIGITVLLVIITVTALVVIVKKTVGKSYAPRTNKDPSSPMLNVGQKVTLAKVINDRANSTSSMQSEKENTKREKGNHSGINLDIMPDKNDEKNPHSKEKNGNKSSLQSVKSQRMIDYMNDAGQRGLTNQTEEEQDLDQVYFSNSPQGTEEKGRMTYFNYSFRLTENAEMDEDMYLVPNTILKSKEPYLQSQGNNLGQNLNGKQTDDIKTEGIYLVPDKNLESKSSLGDRQDFPVYLEVLPDKNTPSLKQPFTSPKMPGVQTNTDKVHDPMNVKKRKKRQKLKETKNGRGEMDNEGIPQLMEEYIQKKQKQDEEDDGNDYFDMMQLKQLCNKHGKGVNTGKIGNEKRQDYLQDEDELDEEMYLIPNQPQ